MTTQHDAADLYTTLQDRAASDQQQLTAARVDLAEQRTEREVRRELAALSDQANDESQHSMGAVAWLLLACVIAGIITAWWIWAWAVSP